MPSHVAGRAVGRRPGFCSVAESQTGTCADRNDFPAALFKIKSTEHGFVVFAPRRSGEQYNGMDHGHIEARVPLAQEQHHLQ